MYRTNKTGKWLLQQTDEESDKYVEAVTKAARVLLKKDREAREKIKTALQDRLTQLRQQRQAKEDSTRTKYEQWIEGVMVNGGLWTSTDDIEKNISSVSKTRKTQALAAQINVRTKVIKTNIAEKIVISKSTVSELKAFLINLMKSGTPNEMKDLLEILVAPISIVSNNFVQQWEDDENTVWVEGEVIDYISDTREYKICYSDSPICYLTTDEFITDIVMGDLELNF